MGNRNTDPYDNQVNPPFTHIQSFYGNAWTKTVYINQLFSQAPVDKGKLKWAYFIQDNAPTLKVKVTSDLEFVDSFP